jgi:ribosomal protein L29
MKKKDLTDLKTKEGTELTKALKEKKGELAKVEIDIKAGKEKNVKKGNNLKRDIARLLTIMREKKILESETTKE